MKKIDLGERTVEMKPAKTEAPRYYQRLTVPSKVDPKMVGKTVTVQVEAKVVGVREQTRDGQKPHIECELEMRSVTMPGTKASPKQAKRSGNQDYAAMRKADSRAGD
jgi:hypothetical protein